MRRGDPAQATTVEPFFLEAPGGRVFAVHHRTADPSLLRGHVLVVPPFNEEMNRCRSMISLQAQALARAGFGTLLVDLHGTGDSAGEHVDARWSLWLDDLHAALEWLDAQPKGCVALLGIRLGAILAAQLSAQAARPARALVFWQPVVDGKLHLTQFLRVRMAAQLDRPNLPKETTASMRKQLEAGESIEVAGYELHPELARAIDGANLTKVAPRGSTVLWLENVSADDAEIPLSARNAVEAWSNTGAAVDLRPFTGPAFWQVHERVVTPSIIDITTQWFESGAAG